MDHVGTQQASSTIIGTPSGYAGDEEIASPYAYGSEPRDFAAVAGLAAPKAPPPTAPLGTAAFVLSVKTPPPLLHTRAVAAVAAVPASPVSPSRTPTADAAAQLLLSIQKARAALGSGDASHGEAPRHDAFWSSMNSTSPSRFRDGGGMNEAEQRQGNDDDAEGATPRELFPAAARRGGGGLADGLRAGRRDRAELLASMRATLSELRDIEAPSAEAPTTANATEIAALRQRVGALRTALAHERAERDRCARSATRDLTSISLLLERGAQGGGGDEGGAAAAWKQRARSAERTLLMVREHEQFAQQLSAGDAAAAHESRFAGSHALREQIDAARREAAFEKANATRVAHAARLAVDERDDVRTQLRAAKSDAATRVAGATAVRDELESERHARRRVERAQARRAAAVEAEHAHAIAQLEVAHSAALAHAAAARTEVLASHARAAEAALRTQHSEALAAARAEMRRESEARTAASETLVADARRSCDEAKAAYASGKADAKRSIAASRAAEHAAGAQLRALIDQYDALLAEHARGGETSDAAARELLVAKASFFYVPLHFIRILLTL